MKSRPIVLIDMDGVLADFDGATHAHLQTPEVNIPLQPRQNFYFRDDYIDTAHVDVINKLHASEHFFRNLPPIEGALEGWNQIQDLGYHPRICSSPLHTNEWCKDEKLEWIKQHLGEAAMQDAIIDSKKELYEGIALIDDRPHIKNGDQAAWRHIVFDAPYNQQSSAELRLHGWQDTSLPELLAQCQELAQNRP